MPGKREVERKEKKTDIKQFATTGQASVYTLVPSVLDRIRSRPKLPLETLLLFESKRF